MKARVSQVTLVVNDQAAALDFYTKKVGFQIKTDYTPPGRQRWVTVAPEGQDLEFALYQVGTPADPRYRSDQWKPGSMPAIVLRVDDVQATYDELAGRGVTFTEPKPVTYPWGTAATFADPDGNHFSIVEFPKTPAWGGQGSS